jgi:hypothetical protein
MRYQTLDEAGVAIQVNQAAFLYVFARDASHDWRRLFPAEEAEAAVERGARYVIPVPLPAEAGADRRVVAIVTRKARPELLSEAADPLAIPIDPGLFIHETAEEAAGDGTSRPTTYLAERHAGSTPILVADVTLPHP